MGHLAHVQILHLNEHSISVKLQTLLSRHLYSLAIDLARSEALGDSSIAKIHQQYGDHLYQKGDYEGAMKQYIRTLGHVPPSYVVRKVSVIKLQG